MTGKTRQGIPNELMRLLSRRGQQRGKGLTDLDPRRDGMLRSIFWCNQRLSQ